jgi:hypothetical protein
MIIVLLVLFEPREFPEPQKDVVLVTETWKDEDDVTFRQTWKDDAPLLVTWKNDDSFREKSFVSSVAKKGIMPISVPHTKELSWCSNPATKQLQQQQQIMPRNSSHQKATNKNDLCVRLSKYDKFLFF